MRQLAIASFTAAATLLSASSALADRALLIGIDSYADRRLDLPSSGSSAKDVADITTLLTGPLGFRREDIATLRDSGATRAAIMAAIDDWLIKGTKPGERVFLYYSGLGYFQDDTSGDEADGLDETLVTYDASVGGGDPALISGGISDDEIAASMEKLGGRRVVVVIDAGHSGIVTASGRAGDTSSMRAPQFGGNTRAIIVEKKAAAQKAEGAPMDGEKLGADMVIYTASSGGQAPLVEAGGGVFTRAFIDAMTSGDVNRNGTLSNAEILAFVRDRSERACSGNPACQLGLTPTMEPDRATGNPLYKAPGATPTLTSDRVLDYFGKGNTTGVRLEQIPGSPVRLGTRDIRFRVASPVAGTLVLLNLTDKGELTQLFPNQYSRNREREGAILAGGTITVPDAYYGIRFDATAATSGTLIALVTTGPVEMPSTVKTRKIEVIPAAEATTEYLPGIAGTLTTPAGRNESAATHSVSWSVATLRYQIGP